jgi:hypothetical protein
MLLNGAKYLVGPLAKCLAGKRYFIHLFFNEGKKTDLEDFLIEKHQSYMKAATMVCHGAFSKIN